MRIITSHKFREKMLDQMINRGRSGSSSIYVTVRQVIKDVREEGDKALLRYTRKFDNVCIAASKLKIGKREIEEAYKRLEEGEIKALEEAAENIACFHRSQIEDFWSLEMLEGVTVGQVSRPLPSVGIYAPGGEGVYPSSVLMCAIPAQVCGVKKIVMCSPPTKDGDVNPPVLVAADMAGVTEIYRVGGAQAIAAMAYGTETVPKVDKIVGPGNAFVTTAKLEVSKDVAIDLPAGPSEVLVIADETADASFVASDLLAQGEHDPRSWMILLTPSRDLASAVKKEVGKQMKSLSRKEIVRSSIQVGGLIVVVNNIQEAVKYSNQIAPEHLQIQTEDPNEVFDMIQNAGAVFLGNYSPVAFGDYSSGLNHVLPTGGYAKSHSGLSTRDFVKTINFLQCTKRGCLNLKNTTMTLARMEGFDGHARSVSARG